MAYIKLSHVFLLLAFIYVTFCEEMSEQSKMQPTQHSHSHSHNHHLPHRMHSGENWLHSFAWNVIGYSVILIPAFFIMRMIKTSNFNEREGQGFMFRLIQCCVFGVTKETATVAPASIFRCFTGTTSSAVATKLIFCTTGLQVSYLTWGVLQEKVMTQKYGVGDEAVHFENSEFLVFMNRIVALVVAATYVFFTGPNWSGPFYKFSFSSLSNICSSWCQYEALKFVSFPTQVLGKASKMIPVMLMGKFVSKKTYQYYEYLVAVMISIGVSLFLMSTASDKHHSAATTVPGIVLMLGYMGFDSFTSNWQSKLFKEYKVSSMQMMFNVNAFSVLFTSAPLLLSGGMFYAVSFMMKYPSFFSHVVVISLTSATGQLFIFYTIGEFGPLVFTIIMVTRQMFSILLSCLIYRHVLSAQAIFGVTIVFMALFLQIYAKHRISQKKQQQQITTREGSDMA